MKLLSSIIWIVVLVLFVSMAAMAQQRSGGGRRGGNNNQNNNQNNQNNNQNNNNQNNNNQRGGRGLPPEGSTREDVLRVTNKTRPMLEIVEMLQKRTGRPISYEDPWWMYEGAKQMSPDGKVLGEIPGDIKRTAGMRTVPNAPVRDTLTLMPGNFEFKMVVDARSHLLPEPIDGSLSGILSTVMKEYRNKQLPGAYTFGYLGNVDEGGYGWIVLPEAFRDRQGGWINPPPRVLDYPISFPVEERPTHVTFQLIAELITKESKQRVEFKKLVSEANMTGRSTETKTVDIPQKQFVKIGATKETARSVIAKALRTIERGDPRTQGPIPQRAWRLLYSIEKATYYLDVVDVRQETYRVNGESSGTRPVNWPTPPAPAAAETPGSEK
jgi:hypothetical protein